MFVLLKDLVKQHIQNILYKENLMFSFYDSQRKAGVCYAPYSKELLASYPNYLFVFGDNQMRVGTGGQAIIRNCHNALGLVTKRAPSTNIDAYMTGTPEDYNAVNDDIERIKKLMEEGNPIIFPASGLGTGLAALNVHAPELLAYIDNEVSKIIKANYEVIRTYLRK